MGNPKSTHGESCLQMAHSELVSHPCDVLTLCVLTSLLRLQTGFRFYLLLALAVSCHGLPNTAEDDVVPERQTMLLQHTAAFTKMSPTAFISAMASSGGSEQDCRTFADETIKTIDATVKSTQGTMNAVATGSSCAALGQDEVRSHLQPHVYKYS